ncbi:MAG: hypothetical protein V1763_00240 [Parcubacteria group bacterium]
MERGTFEEAYASLKNKGYFTPMPRPWKIGSKDQGLGHITLAILDKYGDVVADNIQRQDAELIIKTVNAHAKRASK